MDAKRVRHAIMSQPALAPLNTGQRSNIADILIEIGKPVRIPADSMLFRSGDPSDDQGYILVEGEITVVKEGHPELTAYAPDIIGEMAQLNPTRQRTATVTAATDVQAIGFAWRDFVRTASTRLSEADLKAFTEALQEHAWRHFTE